MLGTENNFIFHMFKRSLIYFETIIKIQKCNSKYKWKLSSQMLHESAAQEHRVDLQCEMEQMHNCKPNSFGSNQFSNLIISWTFGFMALIIR